MLGLLFPMPGCVGGCPSGGRAGGGGRGSFSVDYVGLIAMIIKDRRTSQFDRMD